MINYQKDQDGIVTLCIDMPGQAVNTMNAAFQQAFAATVTQLEQEKESIKGVIITSGKSTFFAGGDLNELLAIRPEQAASCMQMLQENHRAMRRLETLGRPVVVLINGSALGGGLELTLACHHRICLAGSKIELGFPEVTLGLLPGAGGVIRTVRLLGLQNAMPFLVEGQRMNPEQAQASGFIHAIAVDVAEAQAQARAFIAANPNAQQPWDKSGYRIPGGDMTSPKIVPMVQVAPAMLREKTRGNYPAPEAILCSMVEGVQVDFDNALTIEARYFTQLATGQVAKNMISTFFFQMQEMNAGKSRPQGIEKRKAAKVGIIGAGMMGAGIAYANATRGIDCVLHDVTPEKAEQGKQYSAKLLAKRVKQGKTSETAAAATLNKITTSADLAQMADCDLIIEAVFEKRALKADVTQAVAQHIGQDAVMASNTSTLPISTLATAFPDPARFIGLHFFSPVDKMKLVEIIKGQHTAPATLARAYDYVLQLGKYPIVVNDSRGFFTSRVFAGFVNEGMACLQEGLPAALIENAALAVGMPVGPLAVQDEVSLSLSMSVYRQTAQDLAAEGKPYSTPPGFSVVETMLEHKRAGKAAGAGFYDYPPEGKKRLWPGLVDLFGTNMANAAGAATVPYQDVQDRLLYIQSIETLRCLQEGVLESTRDANIGSIFGFGFPAWSGGAVQFVHHVGFDAFEQRAKALQQAYGARFALPQQWRSLLG
jgi:3-hydroxyacyl-CoA dehydrogenase/enoyl-CoA hydratase/3-hydroxybutyryl-CoA epimerase